MSARWTAASVTATLLCALLVPQALAQPRTRAVYPHTISIGVWPTSVTATEPGGIGNWRTSLWILDYRFSSPQSPWGFHAQYATGGQGSWGGTFSTATGGTDTIWSADITYRFVTEPLTLRAFAGFGSIQTQTTLPSGTRRVTSEGARVGLDAVLLLQTTAAGGYWALNAAVAWSPSNSVSAVGVTTAGSGPAADWSASIRYKLPPRTARLTADAGAGALSVTAAGMLAPGGHDFSFELGFRDLNFAGSNYRWSGAFFMIGKTF